MATKIPFQPQSTLLSCKGDRKHDRTKNPFTDMNVQYTWPLTFWLQNHIIITQWVVHMHYMVIVNKIA
jgi:hypothetical protein